MPDKLSILTRIGRDIETSRTIEDVCGVVDREAKAVFSWDRFEVILFHQDPQKGTIVYASGRELQGRRTGDPLTLQGTIEEELLHARTTTRLEKQDREAWQDRYPSLKGLFQAGLQSMWSTPIQSGSEVIGILHFQSFQSGSCCPDVLPFVEHIALEIAGGIARIGLLAEMSKREVHWQEQQAGCQALLQETKDVVFTSTPNGQWFEVNPAGLKLFQYPSMEELLKIDPHQDLIVNSEDWEKLKAILEKESGVQSFEIGMKRKDGTRLMVQETLIPLRDDRGNLVAYRGILRDVTEQRNLERQLLQSQKMEAIGLLVGGVAHDFNNMLTVILGNVQLGLMDMDRSHLHHEILTKIQTEGKKASAITQRLLAFSRGQVLQRKIVAIADQIGNFSRMLSRLIGEDIEVTVECHETVGHVYLDEAALDQVLMNLVVNAREAMPHGGALTIQAHNVTLNEAFHRLYPFVTPAEYVKISVIDTGAGMEPEIRKRIFDPFFTTKKGGTGLGLAVVYGVVKQHKGYIICSSGPGEGSRFDIYFPLHKEPASPREVDVVAGALPRGTETLLVAEDEPEIRNMFRTFLEGLGYHVLVAHDGEEAVKVFSHHQQEIDLVIMDAVMPKLSGPRVYEQMCTMRPHLPCLLLTGYCEEIIRKNFNRGLEMPVLRKPISFEELGKKVRDVLDQAGRR